MQRSASVHEFCTMDGEPRYYNSCSAQIPSHVAKKFPNVYYSKGNVIIFQNADGVTALVPKSKRNPSSSSTGSPSQNGKKSKSLCHQTGLQAYLLTTIIMTRRFPCHAITAPQIVLFIILLQTSNIQSLLLHLPFQSM